MEVVRSLQKIFSDYNGQIANRKKYLQYAASTSRYELIYHLERLLEKRNLKGALKLVLKLANSSIWLSRSSFQLLASYLNIMPDSSQVPNSESDEIIAAVINQKKVKYSDEAIFKAIYNDIVRCHLLDLSSKFHLKKPRLTIVLVSGILNEIFSTPAFARGAENLKNEFGIKFFSANVSGRKSSKENAELIQEQIEQWAENHPHDKLLFICYSKGGIDLLHYLKKYRDKIPPQVIGAHFIASPILGSEHTNHGLLKIVNTLANVPESVAKTFISKEIDLLAKELQKSVSKDFRESWFKKNHELLPKNIFYSALAFESEWHESHIYMMLTKALFNSSKKNDGVVDIENALFPAYFNGLNLGVLKGHHLVSSRSSLYDQEALMSAIIIFLNYKKLL